MCTNHLFTTVSHWGVGVLERTLLTGNDTHQFMKVTHCIPRYQDLGCLIHFITILISRNSLLLLGVFLVRTFQFCLKENDHEIQIDLMPYVLFQFVQYV